MEQLTQKLRSGKMSTREMPWPQLGIGMVLVRNHYSLISPGTEADTVRTARKSLIGKAKERPQQVKQVVEALAKVGPVQTYRAVMKKLDAYSPLGYSSAGEVLETGSAVRGLSQGDKVACAGAQYAHHAEIVSVPEHLCVRLAPDADLKGACYNTLGAIALQGMRQADLRLGENCVVIGLGLLGQLTALMLRAGGINTFGIDIDDRVVELARAHCCEGAWNRNFPGISAQIEDATGGLGADAVIITAASGSLDPINFAGEVARKRGRIVVVGAVPTGFDREPHWYKKELELRMSCSYGPGRYDLVYEEKGQDYPAAYVRWTENRNMAAFQELVHAQRIEIDYLTTHEYALDEAPEAYDMIVSRSEPFLGIVLKYDTGKALERQRITVRPPRPCGKVNLAFIGAGSYAQGSLLPNLPHGDADVVYKGVMTQTGTTSKRVAERFGFEFCTSEMDDILGHPEINTVFVATRHDSHARYVTEALRAGKHVFVEKPLCVTSQELEQVQETFTEHNDRHLLIGFNRRFAPLAVELKQRLGEGPLAMIYRVNAGAIPPGTWAQDPQLGGGRLVGEVCHFIDFMTWMCGAAPTEVHAAALRDPHGLDDTVNLNLSFADGSIGTVCYYANGSKKLAKEYVEVYRAGLTGIITDFRELHVYGNDKPYRRRLLSQDKGQANMLDAFIKVLRDAGPALIEPEQLFTVTRTCFAALESLRTRQSIAVS